MAESDIRLYYKNVSADIIGENHGITKQQFKQLDELTSPVIFELNEEKNSGELPYRDLPFNKEIPKRVKALAANIRDKCENLVVLGIGGSALGNIALQSALNSYMYNLDDKQRKGPRLFVFDNVDPDQFGSFLDWLDDRLENTIFNVVSKSGRTAETAAQFLIIRQLLLDRLGEPAYKKQVIATTDRNKGTLRNIASAEGLATLEVPDGVGGRFSVLSDVGLFSAAVCGIEIDQLLEGARQMDARISSEDFYENPAAIIAAINYHYYQQGKRYSVMMPYSNGLYNFADWYRQLWAESLGKTYDLQGSEVHIGPTPIKALGTTDQHSQVQLYREGPNDKIFMFLQVKNFKHDIPIGQPPQSAKELGYLSGKTMAQLLNSEKVATEYALIQDKRPCMTVLFEKVEPYALGQFIYMYEAATSLTGKLFNINPYDQPAVELGKEATFALMDRPGFEEMAQNIQPFIKPDKDYLV